MPDDHDMSLSPKVTSKVKNECWVSLTLTSFSGPPLTGTCDLRRTLFSRLYEPPSSSGDKSSPLEQSSHDPVSRTWNSVLLVSGMKATKNTQ